MKIRKAKKVKINGQWFKVVSVWSRAKATAATRRALELYDIRRHSEWLVDDANGCRWFATVDPGQPLTLAWETRKYPTGTRSEPGTFYFE